MSRLKLNHSRNVRFQNDSGLLILFPLLCSNFYIGTLSIGLKFPKGGLKLVLNGFSKKRGHPVINVRATSVIKKMYLYPEVSYMNKV